MAAHLYKVGTTVSLSLTDGQSVPKSSAFIIEAQLPPLGTSLQYRIKSQAEGFSRVVVEHQLSSFGSPPGMASSGANRPHKGEED
jgi:hypothetical protein